MLLSQEQSKLSVHIMVYLAAYMYVYMYINEENNRKELKDCDCKPQMSLQNDEILCKAKGCDFAENSKK